MMYFSDFIKDAPKLITKSFTSAGRDYNITRRHLGTKQTIKLPMEEVQAILTRFPQPHNNILVLDDGRWADGEAIKRCKDGYARSELFCRANKFSVDSSWYRAYCTGLHDVVLTVYNGDECKLDVPEITSKLIPFTDEMKHQVDGLVPWPGIVAGVELPYIVWEKETMLYTNATDENCFAINVPLEFYRNIPMNENIFTWSLDQKCYDIMECNEDNVCDMFDHLIQTGFDKGYIPIVYSYNGQIIHMEDQHALTVIMAEFLQIPYIPMIVISLD